MVWRATQHECSAALRQRGCGTGSGILRRVMKWPRSSWCGSPDPGTIRGRAARCSATLEDFDNDHPPAAARAWRAMVCCSAGRLIGVIG